MIKNNSNLICQNKITLKLNSDKIYFASFAFEDYSDNNPSKYNDIYNDIFKRIGEFWNLKQTLNEKALLNLSNDLVKDIEKIYNLLGRENFIFYNDGVVEFKHNK